MSQQNLNDMNETNKQKETQQRLALEQQKYQQRISHLIINISVLWQKYIINDGYPEKIKQEIIYSLNNITLSSVEFGFSNILHVANQSKQIMSIISSENRKPNKEEIEILTNNIKDMHKPVSAIGDNPLFHSHKLKSTNLVKELVYLINEDEKLVEQLSSQLKCVDLDLQVFYQLDEFHKAYLSKKPSIIICGMKFGENENAGTDEISRLNIDAIEHTPIFFISKKEDMISKLSAVKAGGTHFFTEQDSTNKILFSILAIRTEKEQTKLRVLLVDDDQDILNHHQLILDKNKFSVVTQNEPLNVLDTINEFNPEVIVLDNYMPGCSGFELAKIIRQSTGYDDLPIVFLSLEDKHAQQLKGMDIGADDFLTKPVEPDYFNRVIYARALRSRQIKNIEYERNRKSRDADYLQMAIDQHAIVSSTDASGNIIFANEKFCEISGFSLYELLGKTHVVVNSGYHDKSYFDDMWDQISNGKSWHGEVCNRAKNGDIYWVKSTIIPLMDDNELPYQYISIRTDITQIKAAEESARQAELLIKKQQTLLDTIRVAITEFVDSARTKNVAQTLLPELLELTGSKCGFIGVTHQNNGKTVLLTQAITTTLWKEGDKKSHDLNQVGGPVFSNISRLLNLTTEKGEVVICNDVANDSRMSEIQNNYMPDNYLGIPIIYGDKVVGMFGLANRDKDFDEEVIRFLAPFTLTYGVIIHAQDMVLKDIEQRDDIIRSREAAEEANRAKSLFLSNMSHELRTPLNAILGFTQILCIKDDKNPLSDMQHDVINEINNAGEHLISLISNILDLSKIETGIVDVDVESFILSEMLQECYGMMSTLADEEKVTLNFGFHEIKLRTDRQRLKQIILNLISNAIKYNKPNGSVDVSVEIPREGMIRIGVKDTGIGISKDLQENLFKSFQRLGAEKTKIQGTGIGLVIAKSMTEYLDGILSFESEEGVGTQFWIDIPNELSAD